MVLLNQSIIYRGREWIERNYLPELSGRVLWVGVADYTKHYQELVQEPEKFETIDIAPEREVFGSRYKHYVGDFLDFETIREYDHIGLYGLDSKYAPKEQPSWLVWIMQLIQKADHLLRAGGTLLYGGYVEPIWLPLRRIEALKGYREIYFIKEMIGKKMCVKLWMRKPKS